MKKLTFVLFTIALLFILISTTKTTTIAESESSCVSIVNNVNDRFTIELVDQNGNRNTNCRFYTWQYEVLSGEATLITKNEYALIFDNTKKGKVKITNSFPSIYSAEFEIGNSPETSSGSLTISDFQSKYKGKCGQPFAGEGDFVSVKGYVEWANFNKEPLSKKFVLSEGSEKFAQRLEVYINSSNSEEIFSKIQVMQKSLDEQYSDQPVFVSGKIQGFDMPVMGECNRGANLLITTPDQVEIGSTNKRIPPAGYEDDVLTNFSDYENPFPDTDTSSLAGKAAAELYRRAVIGGYPDGEFKGSKEVNRAEAAKFLLYARYGTVADNKNNGKFSDVLDGQWYTKFVIEAANKGIINGYPDGTFRPADTVNTVEFLKMLTLTFDLEKNLSYGYSDVNANDWFAQYAGVAQKYNLFPNRSSNKLLPGRLLTREEVAVAIYQYLLNR